MCLGWVCRGGHRGAVAIRDRDVIATGSGHFVTLEGGEGAGKTTQSILLAEALAARGLPVLRTREPGGAPGAEVLRDILLRGDLDWATPAEMLLHFAARAEHLHKTILPALADGGWVICDRFYNSTMAYQGYGQGVDRDFIAQLTQMLGRRPDLTIGTRRSRGHRNRAHASARR